MVYASASRRHHLPRPEKRDPVFHCALVFGWLRVLCSDRLMNQSNHATEPRRCLWRISWLVGRTSSRSGEAIIFVALSLVFLTGCVSARRPNEPEQKPGIFETPDVDS